MKKADHRADRQSVSDLRQIINVGPAIAEALQRMNVSSPRQLIGADPFRLYAKLCRQDGELHDPCVLDVLISAVEFMNGRPPRRWWEFTPRRKKRYSAAIDELRSALKTSPSSKLAR